MIDWMQKHKKSLIPTIWISTIAFVGAGVVGWGAYDYNKNRAGAVAKVGDIKISNQDFSMKYSEAYNFYRNMSDGKFTDEQAKEMRLENVALQILTQEALLLNFAKDLGLEATQEDIKKSILISPEFQTDGKFNKNLYDQSVKNLGITKNEFERDLAKKLTLDKLFSALYFEPKTEMYDIYNEFAFLNYRINGEFVEYEENNATISDDEIKTFWEDKKDHYLTKKTYELDTAFIEPLNTDLNATVLNDYYNEHKSKYKNSDGKLQNFDEALASVKEDYLIEFNKINADKSYLEIKKGNKSLDKKMVVSEDDFPVSFFENASIGAVNKPFVYENGNLITKITKINEPRPMEFVEAKSLVLDDLKIKLKKDELQKLAEAKVENFKGKDFGFVSKFNTKGLENLSDVEFAKFADKLFNGTKKRDYILFDNKAFIYEVVEKKLEEGETVKQLSESISNAAKTTVNDDLKNDLINKLSKTYKIEYFRKLQ